MFRDSKFFYHLANIAADDQHVFLGFQGAASFIGIYRQRDMGFVGIYNLMCGTPRNMKILIDKEKLICSTSAGYIYVWDTSEETKRAVERNTMDPLTMNGYIHPDARIKPVVEVIGKSVADCAGVDHIPDSFIMVSTDTKGTVQFYDIRDGKARGTFTGFVQEGGQMQCVKVDQQISTLNNRRGHWVTVAGNKGFIGLLFAEIDSVDVAQDDPAHVISENVYSISHNVGTVETVNSLEYRPRSATSVNIILLAGCSDGTVRCVVFKQTEDSLQPHKSVGYQHCKSARRGNVARMIAERDYDGKPYLLSLCHMQTFTDIHDMNEVDGRNATTEASTFCSEIHTQELLNDKSGTYKNLVHMREFVTDMKLAPDQSNLVFCTLDDSYIVKRKEDNKGWERAVRLEWNTLENQKLLSKLI